MSNPTTKLANLEAQLADERDKVKMFTAMIAGMTPPRDTDMYNYWERRRLAASKAVELLEPKIEAAKEQIERDEQTE
jgi:hypothetical protein